MSSGSGQCNQVQRRTSNAESLWWPILLWRLIPINSTQLAWATFNFEDVITILRSKMREEESTLAPLESDLLDPYERLVTIEVAGKIVQVPEKNRLLRCFQ